MFTSLRKRSNSLGKCPSVINIAHQFLQTRKQSIENFCNSSSKCSKIPSKISPLDPIRNSSRLCQSRSCSVPPQRLSDKELKSQIQFNKKIKLNHHHEITLLSEANKIKYLKFKIRGKQVPLNIEIKGLVGNATIFYSQVTQRPNLQAYDKVFNKNCFKIFENGIKTRYFSARMAFLGIIIPEKSQYTVSISFGLDFDTPKPAEIINNKEGKLSEKSNSETAFTKIHEKLYKCDTQTRKHLPLMFSKINLITD